MHFLRNPTIRNALCLYPALVGAVGVVLFLTLPALPHQAPAGWAYGFTCCSGRDCAEAHDGWVKERPDGYHISIPRGHHPTVQDKSFVDVIPYTDKRIKDSMDGHFHVCVGKLIREKQRLLCLYVPPRGM